jgi:hypothetical protein
LVIVCHTFHSFYLGYQDHVPLAASISARAFILDNLKPLNHDPLDLIEAERLGKKVIIAEIRGPAAALGWVRVRLAEARRTRQ